MDWKYRLKVCLHGRTWTCRSWHTCSLTWFPSCSLFLLWDVKLRSKLEFFCWKYKGEEMLTWRYLILADLPYCKKVCCTCSASISDIMGSSPFTNSLIKQNKFNIILSMHLVVIFWTLYLVHFCTIQCMVGSIQIHIKISFTSSLIQLKLEPSIQNLKNLNFRTCWAKPFNCSEIKKKQEINTKQWKSTSKFTRSLCSSKKGWRPLY
jgi:hypothetical protein